MLGSNIKSGGSGVNLYINGFAYHFSKYGNTGQQKHSFLIPKTDYDQLVNYLADKIFNFKSLKFSKYKIIDNWCKLDDVDICFSIIEFGEEVWYRFRDDKMIYIFEDVYLHDNSFEFKVDSGKIKMDKNDLRDLKIIRIFTL